MYKLTARQKRKKKITKETNMKKKKHKNKEKTNIMKTTRNKATSKNLNHKCDSILALFTGINDHHY